MVTDYFGGPVNLLICFLVALVITYVLIPWACRRER